MPYKELDNNSFVFSLDIGTRSVIGILGKRENDKIIVEHMETEFHKKRAMYEGQIHDINSVADAAEKVKLALEEKANCTLDEVTIAVAGRSLQTNKVTVYRETDPIKDIDADLINSLEIEGLQKAKHELEKQSEEYTRYFCVGYTVVHYYIDDVMITDPLGHRGHKIAIDILATFLPQMVVDSLYAVISKLGLEIKYMTLEPIAAIEVAVPENVRLLNLALVDIGAGTSDIAVTRDGTITAYGMTSSAGDDITEQIAKEYLLDFDEAEKLKINLNKENLQKFSSIVDIPYEIESDEILRRVEPTIRKVADLIADKIIEQNGKPPSAVFLIGGGSQLPWLDRFIAEGLNLPKERVVVRGIEAFKDTVLTATPISGPEYVTPIGILTKTLRDREPDFIEIYVNERRFKLFQTKKLKVKDALVLTGFNPRKLIPERGKSINVSINGSKRVLHGEYGEAAKIIVNGEVCNMESDIKNGDAIKIYPAKEGRPKTYLLKNVLPLQNKIFINENPTPQIYNYVINNKIATQDTVIEDGDHIKYDSIKNMSDLCLYMGVDYGEYIFKINNKIAKSDQDIKNGDYINIERKTTGQDLQKSINYPNKKTEPKGGEITIKCNDSIIKIPDKKDGVVFIDIFDYIDFDRSKAYGKLVLLLNGRKANYTDSIKTGDEVRIYWDC